MQSLGSPNQNAFCFGAFGVVDTELQPLLVCLGWSLCSAQDSDFLLLCSLEATSDSSSRWFPASQVEGLDEDPAFRLPASPSPAVLSISSMNQQMEEFISVPAIT